jgi:hypothetical protein
MSSREIRIDRLRLSLPPLSAGRSAGNQVAFARSVATGVAEALGQYRPTIAIRTLGDVRVQLRRTDATPVRIAQEIAKAIGRKEGGR